MKKNFLKTITLILSCLLLIGAMIGISAFAEDETTVEIKYRNLAYEAAPQLVYYVDAQNVAEGNTVKVLFYNAQPAAASLETAVYVADSFGTLTVSGVDYAAFASDEIAPKNLRLAIWALPVVVDAEGNIVALGTAVKYSVFDYALDRFNLSPTPDQIALYTAVLDFGGAVQEVLYAQGKYTDEELAAAGGFANEYCGIRQDVKYEGSVVETGDVTYYKKGDVVTLSVEDYTYDAYGIFRGFLDENGDLVAEGAYKEADVYAAKPGVTVYESEYTVTGTLFNSYDFLTVDGSADDVNTKYAGKRGDDLKNAIGVNGLKSSTFGAAKDATAYARVEKESENSENQVFSVGANGTASGNAYAWTLDSVAVNASKYVFQTDFKWDGSDISTQPIYFRIDSTDIYEDKCDILLFQLVDSGAGYSYYTLDGTQLNKGQWYTMRVEIVPHSATHYSYFIYFDGVLGSSQINRTPADAAPIAQNEVNKFIGFRMFNRKATNYDISLDNTYVGVEYENGNDNRGNGEYFADETKIGTKYTYDDLEDITTDNVLYTGSSGKISSDDDSFFFSSGDPNGGFGIKYDGEKVSGNTYVLETDVYFGGGKASKGYDQLAWLGLTAADGTNKANHFLALTFHYKALGGTMNSLIIKDFSSGNVLATIPVGTWVNLRVVYTVNNTLNEDGTVAENGYGGKVAAYVNGELVKEYDTKGYTASGTAAGSASNEKLTNLGFEMRSTQWCGVTELQWQFDNTYLGVYDVEPPVAE